MSVPIAVRVCSVYQIWSGVDPNIRVELRYYALRELRHTFHNILSLPNEVNFRSVDVKTRAFTSRLGRIPQVGLTQALTTSSSTEEKEKEKELLWAPHREVVRWPSSRFFLVCGA